MGGRAAGGRGREREAAGEGKKKERRKAYSTRYSQAVSHPSTNQARPCLASEIRRDRARSGWYGRRRLRLPPSAPRVSSAPPSPSPSPCRSIVSPPPPGLCLLPACLPAFLPASTPRGQDASGTPESRKSARSPIPGLSSRAAPWLPGWQRGGSGRRGPRTAVFSERPPNRPVPPRAFPPLLAAGLKAPPGAPGATTDHHHQPKPVALPLPPFRSPPRDTRT